MAVLALDIIDGTLAPDPIGCMTGMGAITKLLDADQPSGFC